MKKSKKALLWTIVPVLGVSSGVAGAVAGVTNQKTSVDTNNVATPGSATTMATRSSSGVASKLKIERQSYDVINFSGETNTMYVSVSGSKNLRYEWFVNKDGKKWTTYIGGRGVPSAMVQSPKTSVVLDWTFRCVITDVYTKESITSEDIKFTTLPSDGRYISVTKQPEAKKTVDGGQKVTLTTEAKAIGRHSTKTVGYQWFEYDSSNNKFTEIKDATSSTYTFIAPSYTTKSTTKKYVCKYYFVGGGQSRTYLNESNQSIITINKDVKETFEVDPLIVDKTNVKVGDTITLSVTASSSKTETKDLKYQWLKSDGEGKEYKAISEPGTSSSFEYEIAKGDEGKNLLFSVFVIGRTQDEKLNHFQGGNVEVRVSAASGTSSTATNEIFTNNLSVSSSVTTNQASVKESTFILVRGIRAPEYTVNVKGASGLTYKWYYVSGNNKQLISGANENVLTTDRSLYQAVYKANDKHRVGIMCEIYQGNELVKVVDEKTDSRFYMTVITRR